jgi:hypothetical protein
MVKYTIATVAALVALAFVLGTRHSHLLNSSASLPTAPVLAQRPQSNTQPPIPPLIGSVATASDRPITPNVTVTLREGAQSRDAAIDGPFPMSASVDAGCRSLTLGGRGATCDRLRRDLSVMAHEPRDEAWAADIEAKLQNLIDSQKSDDLSIRNIECRTTYCALELARMSSSSRKYTFIGGYLPYGTPIYDQITWTGGFGVGTENDPSGEEITVSLFTYRRK